MDCHPHLLAVISILFLNCYFGHSEANTTTTQAPPNITLRSELMDAARFLSNTLHKRFHKNQKIILYTESDVDVNFIFNPVEISVTLGVLMSGMVHEDDFEELSELLGYRKVQMSPTDMFKAMQQYLYNEQYNVSMRSPRKIYLSSGIFTNQNFELLETFKKNAKTLFQSEIYNISKYRAQTKVKEIQDFISNKTNTFIPPVQRMNSSFNVMIIGTTYIRDLWLYPMESTNVPLELTCITQDNEEFKIRTNTRIVWTWYYDLGDRFGIIIPFRQAKTSLFFYVPKTEDLFKELDEDMNYEYMKKMLDEMLVKELVHVNVTFPLIDISYSRNLTYDLKVKGISSIFSFDSIQYLNMTQEKNLFVDEIFHKSILRMTERGFRFASMTYLTIKKIKSTLKNENPKVLQNLVKELRNGSSDILNVDYNPDFLLSRSNKNNKLYKKTVGKKISSNRPTLKESRKRKKNQKPKVKRIKSKNCRKSKSLKRLRIARNNKIYKAKLEPPYFKPTSTLSLTRSMIHREFFFLNGGLPKATESFESCFGDKSSSYPNPASNCTKSITRHYTLLTAGGTEMLKIENSLELEMKRKRYTAEEPLPNYKSKSNRKNKALLPADAVTKWGLSRPRFTWTGPGTTPKGYTFPQQRVLSVQIKNSFFYAIVNHATGTFFAIGKVSHCKA